MAEGAVEAVVDADGCLGCAHGLHCLPLLLVIAVLPALLIWG